MNWKATIPVLTARTEENPKKRQPEHLRSGLDSNRVILEHEVQGLRLCQFIRLLLLDIDRGTGVFRTSQLYVYATLL
jgi:hypothetical protein